MIADVIRNADSEAALYSMLTSYIQAARVRGAILYLPEQVMRLPLAGCADTNDRFSMLVTALGATSGKHDERAWAVLTEALHVFGAAVYRLTVMNFNHKPAPPMRRSARQDTGSHDHAV